MSARGPQTLRRFKVLGSVQDDELNLYKRIEECSKAHPGRDAVRFLLDSFDIDGLDGRHRCLVHPPLRKSLLDLRHSNPIRRLPSPAMAIALRRLFQALDFLHKECHVAHTDIKEGDILPVIVHYLTMLLMNATPSLRSSSFST
jgi:serine/threonine-protein kinase SRPK3